MDTMGNRDYKYVMQDVSNLYLGARFTYEEMLEEEDIPFKFKSIIQHYIKPEMDMAVSMESHFYYMVPSGFIYQVYKQLKTKVKISLIVEKKTLTGGMKKKYDTQTVSLEKFMEMSPSEKEKQGIMIQEIAISKLALMSFSL